MGHVQSLKYQYYIRRSPNQKGEIPTHFGPCPYCNSKMSLAYSESSRTDYFDERFSWQGWSCRQCGWWWCWEVPDQSFTWGGMSYWGTLHKAKPPPTELLSAIKEIDGNKNTIHTMHPTNFERFVGDVLKEFYDCKVVYTGKSHDGGIDLILLV